MEGNKNFGILYRNGPESASNTLYAFFLANVLTTEKERILRLDFVRRYDLPVEQLCKIVGVVNRHKGLQDNLLQKIDEVIDESKEDKPSE
jgi:hypothetical protein